MLHLLTATHTEAKPLIHTFKLKKKDFNEFHIYINKNKNISLTITGIGKINSSAATSYTAIIFNHCKNNVWLNIGICGHKIFQVGEIFLVNKVIDQSSSKVWYPSINFKTDIKQATCLTVDEITKYDENLLDMELSGIQQTSLKFSTIEFVHSLKIVSDNENQSISKSKNEITKLIDKKLNIIENFIVNISILNDKTYENQGPISSIFKLLEKQGYKKNCINKIFYLLKRFELYNGKISHRKIIELINNKSNLVTFLNFRKYHD